MLRFRKEELPPNELNHELSYLKSDIRHGQVKKGLSVMIILESDPMLLWPEGSESDYSSGEAPARRRTTLTIGTFSGEVILIGVQLK